MTLTLKLDSLLNERRDPSTGLNNGTGFETAISTVTGLWVENLWVNHTTAPVWYAGNSGTIINSRSRGSYAGGFHIQGSGSNNLIKNNHTRGAGDAGMVVWSPTSGSQAVANTLSYNTVEGTYFGDGTDLAGGQNTVYDSNLISGGLMFTGLRFQTSAGTNANNPNVNNQVTNNVFDHANSGDPTIAIADEVLINPTMDSIDATISGNTFSNLDTAGIEIMNSYPVTLTITGNTIYQPTTGTYFNNTNTNTGSSIVTTPNTLLGSGGPTAAPSTPASPSATGGSAQVSLFWTASSGATSYRVKRSISSGGPYTTVSSPTTNTYIDTGLNNGTTYYYVVSAFNVVSAVAGSGESANSSQVSATTTGLPLTDLDIGGPGMAGTASLSSGTWTVAGGGADIWGMSDQFNYAYKSSTGNTTIIARVISVQNTNVWAKAGVMIRESTAANAKEVSVFVTSGAGVIMRSRSTSGANTAAVARFTAPTVPYWVKLVRSGSTFTGYMSPDGVTWTPVGSATVSMASNATQGLAVTATDNTQLNTSTFDNFSTTP